VGDRGELGEMAGGEKTHFWYDRKRPREERRHIGRREQEVRALRNIRLQERQIAKPIQKEPHGANRGEYLEQKINMTL